MVWRPADLQRGLGGVHLSLEAGALGDEGQRHHARVVADEDGVELREVHHLLQRRAELRQRVHEHAPAALLQLLRAQQCTTFNSGIRGTDVMDLLSAWLYLIGNKNEN